MSVLCVLANNNSLFCQAESENDTHTYGLYKVQLQNMPTQKQWFIRTV